EDNTPCLRGFSRRFLISVGCCSLMLIVLTEVWYRCHALGASGQHQWSATLPAKKNSFQEIGILPSVAKSLRYDKGVNGKWREEDGSEWTVYFFHWNPKSMESVIRARGHRPDICLPAVGFRQVSSFGVDYFQAGALRLPFQKYTYEADGRFVYVFFCLWQDGDEEQSGMRTLGVADRLKWAFAGRRRLG